jgi:Mg-chelatase subunit ChlD
MSGRPDTLPRWRLVLGRYAGEPLGGGGLSGRQLRMEHALDFLYSREYQGRGQRDDPHDLREGSLDPSQIAIPEWLSEVRELFPRETVEVLERHALERYGLRELVTDPEVLRKLEPSMDLLRVLLSFRGQLKGRVLDEARRLIRQVVEEIKARIEPEIRNAFVGRIDRFRRSRLQVARNLDWRGTIRRNLKHWDPERRQLLVEEIRFFSRRERRLPWTLVLCVDQSGSMAGSVIHSAVMAGILAGLPLLKVKLVVFDTSVVDLSGYVDDPVEVLMSVQLGGGTDIGKAMAYCESLVEDPGRTVVVLVSDFCEGAAPGPLLATCRRLAEARVRLLGLAALDPEANPFYDRAMAERLAATGMEIAALTPRRLAQWLAKTIS